MSLQQKAEEYFSTINSMASRVCVDMRETQLSYENLWQTIGYEEQQQILDQSIIKPEVSLKYPLEEPRPESTQYALKMIVDDHCTYRDEHSAPFSFRTSSQRDLTLIDKKISPKKAAKVLPPKAIMQVIPKVVAVKKEVVLPPPESIDDDDEGDTDSLTHILPKTGLDLLDNW